MDHQHQSSGRRLGGGGSATSSSSEEISNEGQERDSTTKRSYECTFCKRGFTNAQALGGHMNIHRRDRGKAAKQAPTNPSSRNKNPDSYNHVGPTNQSPTNYHDDADHLNLMPPRFNYPVFEAQRVNYPMYFQAPGLNPSNFCSAARSSSTSQCLVDVTTNEGVWGANLSLRTGSSNNNQVEEEIENVGSRRAVSMEDEEELDLELRLGHHP